MLYFSLKADYREILDFGFFLHAVSSILAFSLFFVHSCQGRFFHTIHSELIEPAIFTFYTDGGVLGPGLSNAPVAVLGQGNSGMAHIVDEYVTISELTEGVALYLELLPAYVDNTWEKLLPGVKKHLLYKRY